MRSYASVLTAILAATCVSAGPTKSFQDLAKRQSTPSGTGTSNGYFYSWWTDDASPATYTNEEGGRYTVQWEAGGNLVGGKGWQTGGAKDVTYSGTWEPVNNGNAYLAIYGWTRSPLVEYYIVENHGDYDPGSAGESRGSFTASDGGTYSLYESTRTNQPSIDGTATFQQYWAVRDTGRVGGTVNTGEFFDAWAGAGMTLGTHDYMIVATEGYQSAGSSDITVESAP